MVPASDHDDDEQMIAVEVLWVPPIWERELGVDPEHNEEIIYPMYAFQYLKMILSSRKGSRYDWRPFGYYRKWMHKMYRMVPFPVLLKRNTPIGQKLLSSNCCGCWQYRCSVWTVTATLIAKASKLYCCASAGLRNHLSSS